MLAPSDHVTITMEEEKAKPVNRDPENKPDDHGLDLTVEEEKGKLANREQEIETGISWFTTSIITYFISYIMFCPAVSLRLFSIPFF